MFLLRFYVMAENIFRSCPENLLSTKTLSYLQLEAGSPAAMDRVCAAGGGNETRGRPLNSAAVFIHADDYTMLTLLQCTHAYEFTYLCM